MRAKFGARTVRGAAALLVAACVAGFGATAAAAGRVALVMGNGDYARFGGLVNPANDARAMARTLEGLGFTLVGGGAHVDVTRRAMARLLGDLEDALLGAERDAGSGATALVYYSGHGVAEAGTNWLVPVDDADIEFREDVPTFAISARDVMRRLEGRAGGVNILVLDACRNNPLESRRKTKGGGVKGLAPMSAPSQTVIVYAAAPGKVAYDGVAGGLSPFTGALVSEMGRAGRRLEDVLGATAAVVERETAGMAHGRQEPWLEMKPFREPFYFVPPEDEGADDAGGGRTGGGAGVRIADQGGGGTVPARIAAEQLAARAYEAAERVDTVGAYEAVVKRFPESIYADLARAHIAKLEAAQDPAAGAGTAPLATASAGAAAVPAASQPAVSVPAPAVPAPEAVESSLGLERSERRAVQRALASLGYAPGPADGWFGERTRAAIRHHQSAAGAEATGYLTVQQAKALVARGEEDVRNEAQRQAEAERAKAEAARRERERREKEPGRRIQDCPECPELVVVPSGSFMMGSPSGEVGRYRDEGPVHRVRIAEPFAVGVYEVTFAEWDACRRWGGCRHRPDDRGWGRGSRPIIDVSWDDAKQYVRWLSRKTGERYRLLSESEWEYVARAGTRTPFHTGETISTDQANHKGGYADGSGRKKRYRNQTAPVGHYSPNGFGLHDVHGNVREWVEDCWHESYAGAPSDGRAWTSGGHCSRRVLRGGSWYNTPGFVRSAVRNRDGTGNRYFDAGFRVARTLD